MTTETQTLHIFKHIFRFTHSKAHILYDDAFRYVENWFSMMILPIIYAFCTGINSNDWRIHILHISTEAECGTPQSGGSISGSLFLVRIFCSFSFRNTSTYQMYSHAAANPYRDSWTYLFMYTYTCILFANYCNKFLWCRDWIKIGLQIE